MTRDIEAMRAAVLGVFPQLAAARFRVLAEGWHSVAVEADERLVFKFPKDAAAAEALTREAGLLRAVRAAVTLPVPELTLQGDPVFSRHAKIPGAPLLPAQYARLRDAARQRLAEDMARFHAELHGLERERMAAAGAATIETWPEVDVLLARLQGLLPESLRDYATQTLAAWAALPRDPYGTVYGFFDGHGWNMAFDHRRGRLNGVFDFADSGFGALHREFLPAAFVAPDFASRLVAAYERLTGRMLDRERIAVLTGVLRLKELAEADAAWRPAMLRNVAAWAGRGR